MEELRPLMRQVCRMSVQARQIKTKRKKPRRKRTRVPKTVQVRQGEVQVRCKPNCHLIHPVIDPRSGDAPDDSYPLPPIISSRPPRSDRLRSGDGVAVFTALLGRPPPIGVPLDGHHAFNDPRGIRTDEIHFVQFFCGGKVENIFAGGSFCGETFLRGESFCGAGLDFAGRNMPCRAKQFDSIKSSIFGAELNISRAGINYCKQYSRIYGFHAVSMASADDCYNTHIDRVVMPMKSSAWTKAHSGGGTPLEGSIPPPAEDGPPETVKKKAPAPANLFDDDNVESDRDEHIEDHEEQEEDPAEDNDDDLRSLRDAGNSRGLQKVWITSVCSSAYD
ncbi:hypothetical protein B0H13DRAFT_1880372 [Mycena leptocephala]|nr:hypothetical protein B0H13DRAFT_1880372 [Mycena leptocephala]